MTEGREDLVLVEEQEGRERKKKSECYDIRKDTSGGQHRR